MATKTSEAILRVRAQNLAKKDLRGVSADLDAITQSQRKNASASGLAARSLRELTEEQRSLATVAAELNRRGGIAGNLIKQREQVVAAAQKVRELRGELQQLQSTKASGTFVGDIDKAIRNVEKSLKRANTDLDKQNGKFQKIEQSAAQVGIASANAAEMLKQINTEAARTEKLMVEAAGAVERYNGALVESKASLAAQEAIQREITEEARRRNEVEARAAAQRRSEAAALSAQLAQQAKRRADAAAAFSAMPGIGAAAAAGAALGPNRPLSGGDAAAVAAAREAGIRERLINVIRRQEAAGKTLVVNNDRQTRSTRGLTGALDRNASSLDRNHRATGLLADTGRKSLSVYQRLRGQVLATAAAYVGLYQAANLVKSAVTVEQDRRRINIQLKTANQGDEAAAARDQKFLREQADRLGLVYEDLAKNFANYKIAAREVGAANSTISRTFVEAAEIVTGLALSTEDAQGVFRAFVQILGKNRVQAEELRGQLGDRLPGAVAKFAQTLVETGKIDSFAGLDDYLKKGKAGVEDLFNFLRNYAKTTKAGVEENSQTLFAQFNRLKNVWRDFLEDFAKAGTSNEVLEIVNKLIAKLQGNEGAKFAESLAKAFMGVAKALIFVIDNFDKFILVLKLFLAFQAAKAVYDIGATMLVTGARTLKAAQDFSKFTAATNAAVKAGGKLTLGMRALLLLTGPVGIALTALAVALYWVATREDDATKAAKKHAEVMAEINGLAKQSREDAIKLAMAKREEALATLASAKAALIEAQAKARAAIAARQLELGKRGLFSGAGRFTGQREGAAAMAAAKKAEGAKALVQELGSEVDQLTSTMMDLAKAGVADLAAEAMAALEKDKFEQPPTEGADGSSADKAKAMADKRAAIAKRAANELLEIEKALSEVRLTAEVTTQDQIDANYREHLAIIEAETQKRRNDLLALKRAAEAAGSADGVSDAQKALDQLPALQQVLNAKARQDAVTESIRLKESQINELIGKRDDEIELINTKVHLGLLSEGEGRQKVLDIQKQYKEEIQSTITALQDQLIALAARDPNLARILHVDELLAKLELAKTKAGDLQSNIELIGKKLGGEFASGAASALDTLIMGLAGAIDGVNGIGGAFKNAGRAFLSFLASFLSGIAQAIMQAIILQAIMNAIKGTSGGYGAAVTQALTGHTGGVVGGSDIGGNPVRQVSAAMFIGAQRFHEGGLPGLRPNEVPAILKKREEVLAEDDPRNVLNGGLSQQQAAPNVDLSIYNNFDAADVVSQGMSTPAGKRALFNEIKANAPKYRRLLGVQ
jgi:tape measure domain-containing protein